MKLFSTESVVFNNEPAGNTSIEPEIRGTLPHNHSRKLLARQSFPLGSEQRNGGGELSTSSESGVILRNVVVGKGSSVCLVSTSGEAVKGTSIAVGDGQEVHFIRQDGPLVVKNMEWSGSDNIVPLSAFPSASSPSSVKAEIKEEPCRPELNENRGFESVILGNENVGTGPEELNTKPAKAEMKTSLSFTVEDSLGVEAESCSLKHYIGYLQSELDKSQICYLNMGDFQLHNLVEKQKKELLLQITKSQPNSSVLGLWDKVFKRSDDLLLRGAKQKTEHWYRVLYRVIKSKPNSSQLKLWDEIFQTSSRLLSEGTEDDDGWWNLWDSILEFTMNCSQLEQLNKLLQTAFGVGRNR